MKRIELAGQLSGHKEHLAVDKISAMEALVALERRETARDRLVYDQSKHVAQIARSAALLLEANHEVGFLVLLRALTDSLFRTAWGLSDESRAEKLEVEAHHGFRSNLKNLVEDGALRFPNPQTGLS